MDITRALPKPQEHTTFTDHSKNSMTTSKGSHNPKKESKQRLDYVLRTGLAGGLAGCAVYQFSYPGGLLLSKSH